VNEFAQFGQKLSQSSLIIECNCQPKKETFKGQRGDQKVLRVKKPPL